MQRIFTFAFFVVATLFLGSLTSCLEDKCTSTWTYQVWEPVYVQVDDIRKDIKMEGPRELTQPGKIYYYQDMIFINEYRKGIHVVDNQDPSNPQAIAFINIPGNVDMAAAGNLLYADNYIYRGTRIGSSTSH